MIAETSCDGVMIARGAQGNPWIFRRIACAMDGVPFPEPTLRERLAIALEHAEDLGREKGERVGIMESRKHMAWYLHDLRGAAGARNEVMSAVTVADIQHLFTRLLEENE